MQRQNLTYRLNVDDQVASLQAMADKAGLAVERWMVGWASFVFMSGSVFAAFQERLMRHLGAAAQWLRELEASDGPVPGDVQRWAVDTVATWADGRVRDNAGVLLLDRTALAALAGGSTGARVRVRALAVEMLNRKLPIATVTPMLAALEATDPGRSAAFEDREGVQLARIDRRVGVRAGELLAATGAGSDKSVDAWLVALAEIHTGGLLATTDPSRFEQLAAHTWFPVTVVDVSG